MYKLALSWCVGALIWMHAGTVLAQTAHFPEVPELRSAVEFWKRIYIEVPSSGGLLHDSRHLGVVYEVLSLDESQSRASQKKAVERARTRWTGALKHLAAGDSPDAVGMRRIVEQFRVELGRTPRPGDYADAGTRIRFQRGQRDKFKAGLVRAGAHETYIRSVLRERGLPQDLAYLPHVESSFQTHAESKYGAAGMWQFMPATGRRFLAVNQLLDERLDPRRSSQAAAQLLANNYAKLGSWPLALTAYNHGAAGMRRAVKKVGTTNLGVIWKNYDGRSFGFASRNFYAQFLAARQVAKDAEKYFGDVVRQEPIHRQVLTLPFYADVQSLARRWGMPVAQLRELNPAIRDVVWTGGKRLPRDYRLNVPMGDVSAWLATIPATERHTEQVRLREHTVARGENLAGIAARYATSVRRLVELNGLANANRIYPGQRLELSVLDKAGRAAVAVALSLKASRPKPKTDTADATLVVAKLTLSRKLGDSVHAEKSIAKPIRKPVVRVVSTPPALLPIEKPDSAELSSAVSLGLPPARLANSKWRRIVTGFVVVDSGETLGHFADWLEVSTRQLRKLNNLSRARPLRIGQRLKLDFARVSSEVLIRKRLEYHDTLEKAFLADYRITGTLDHTVKRGDSLWSLSHGLYAVPSWLMHRYNPRAEPSRVELGTRITVPLIEKIIASSS